jgi:biopolymer transport protein TolR
MISTSKKRGYKSEINITPYIDILLVMLIIFMVATPIRKHDLPVRVPQPAPPDQPKVLRPDTIILEVAGDRTITLNKQPIPLDELESKLNAIYRARANKHMFLRGNSELPYGEVFNVMDIAKRAGVMDIALLAGSLP